MNASAATRPQDTFLKPDPTAGRVEGWVAAGRKNAICGGREKAQTGDRGYGAMSKLCRKVNGKIEYLCLSSRRSLSRLCHEFRRSARGWPPRLEVTTMGTAAKTNGGLEDHDLKNVSGGLAASSQVMTEVSYWKGPFQLDLQAAIWETQFRGPKHLAMPAGT
jgi:hypothetical protein